MLMDGVCVWTTPEAACGLPRLDDYCMARVVEFLNTEQSSVSMMSSRVVCFLGRER